MAIGGPVGGKRKGGIAQLQPGSVRILIGIQQDVDSVVFIVTVGRIQS